MVRSRDPKTRHDLATDEPVHKPGKSRHRRFAPHASKDEKSTEVEDVTLVVLSGSRSTSRRKALGARS